jgi:hypothetical protein
LWNVDRTQLGFLSTTVLKKRQPQGPVAEGYSELSLKRSARFIRSDPESNSSSEHRTPNVHLFIMKGMNVIAQAEVAQVSNLPYRRLPVGSPYTRSKVTYPAQRRRKAHDPSPKNISKYFPTCETPHKVCAPIRGEGTNAENE